jgi:hypothetical protein
MKIISCPSCGGEVKIKSVFSKSATCAYCGQSSYIYNDHVEAKGGKAFLADYGSLFSVGQRFKWNKQNIEIIGRIRYEYEEGFWDEWAVILNDKDEQIYWLEEDEGRLSLFSSATIPSEGALASYEKVKVGATIDFQKKRVFIRAKSKAKMIGSEGELPFQVLNGEKADFIDGIYNSNPCSFEFLATEITFNEGQVLHLHDFQF